MEEVFQKKLNLSFLPKPTAKIPLKNRGGLRWYGFQKTYLQGRFPLVFFFSRNPQFPPRKLWAIFFEKKTLPSKIDPSKIGVNDLSNIFLKPNLPQPRCAQVTQKSPVPNLACSSVRLATIVSLCIFFLVKHCSFWFILNTGKPVGSMVCEG